MEYKRKFKLRKYGGNHINFQLLKHFGLSLSTKKKYFIIYDPCTWTIMYVYDDLETALVRGYRTTLDKYRDEIRGKSEFLYRDSSGNNIFAPLDENFVGHAYGFYKGFMQNLDVWQLLQHLTDGVVENYDWDDIAHDTEPDDVIPIPSYFVLQGIHKNLQAYPDFIDEKILTVSPKEGDIILEGGFIIDKNAINHS